MYEMKKKAINLIATATKAVFSADVTAEEIIIIVNDMLTPTIYGC